MLQQLNWDSKQAKGQAQGIVQLTARSCVSAGGSTPSVMCVRNEHRQKMQTLHVQVQCCVGVSSNEDKMNNMIGECELPDPGGSTTAQAGHSG